MRQARQARPRHRAQRDGGHDDHAEGGRAQEDIGRASDALGVVCPHHQEPLEIDPGRGQGGRIERAFGPIGRFDHGAEAAGLGGPCQQPRRDRRTARPRRPFERGDDAARKPAAEREIERAEAAANHALLGQGERLGGGGPMPRG